MKFDEEKIKSVCEYLVRKWPERNCDFYKMGLSAEVLRVLIDNEWTNQSIFPNNHPTSSRAVQEAITFLRTRERGFQFQERVSKLAIRLFNTQNIPGIKMVVDKIKSGDIYGGYAELEAGDFFVRRDISFEFVVPTGEKGKDFDIKIINNLIVNCEVKHKIESTNPSKKALETTLSSANKQVPSGEPALFFIKIPAEWVNNQKLKNIVERTKGTFFPRNSHVIGFILHWEEKDPQKPGVFYWKYRYEKNNFCLLDSKKISEQLAQEVNWIDAFIQMMRKYIKKC